MRNAMEGAAPSAPWIPARKRGLSGLMRAGVACESRTTRRSSLHGRRGREDVCCGGSQIVSFSKNANRSCENCGKFSGVITIRWAFGNFPTKASKPLADFLRPDLTSIA
jgi:hypothetical protein